MFVAGDAPSEAVPPHQKISRFFSTMQTQQQSKKARKKIALARSLNVLTCSMAVAGTIRDGSIQRIRRRT